MIRRSLVIATAMLLQGCAGNHSPSFHPYFDSASYDFETEEQSPQNTAQNHFVRSGDAVDLKFRKGQTVEIRDSEGCFSTTCAKHWVVGYWPETDSFLVGVWYYEDPGTIIVTKDKKLPLIDYPIHSKTNERFVAFNDGNRIGDIAVQIGRWVNLVPEVEYESFYDQSFPRSITDNMSIGAIGWISDNALEFELLEPTDQVRAALLVGERKVDGQWVWFIRAPQ